MSTAYNNYREAIKNAILKKLYQAQLDYWNGKLLDLSRANAVAYGRNDGATYAIYFRNKRWAPEHVDWTDNLKPAYCLPLHPSSPNFVIQMGEIADELEELVDEKYEAERFLSSLVLFTAPPNRFKEVLGETLYAVCRADVEGAAGGFDQYCWNANDDQALQDFVKPNARIIAAMNERVLLNLVTIE